jgi:hypothetical protein
MDDLLNCEYNGWENRFTWRMHLRLSNEQMLFPEIAKLVANERFVEMWLKSSIINWMNRFPGRNRYHGAYICLLVWDLLGSALAYSEWDNLVTVLTGSNLVSNDFTMTLHRCIQQSQQLNAHIEVVLRDATSVYAAADALKE